MKKRTVLYLAAAMILLGVLGYSVYRLISMNADYSAESKVHEALLRFKPEASADYPAAEPSKDPDTVVTEPFLNEKIAELQEEYPNAIGWITVPGTDVDYPFTQGPDNDYYLRRGLDGNYLYAGVPFLDYRCAPDFSDGNTIIYGHNLRNGTMFGTLESFKTQQFFQEHRTFTVYLRDKTIEAEIIACVVFQANHAPFLYQVSPQENYLSDLSKLARCTADLSAIEDGARFITLSTCDYEAADGRTVLVGRILE